MTCSFEQCERPVKAKDLCLSHYQQRRRGRELTPLRTHPVRPNATYCNTCDTQKSREDFHLRTDGSLQWECKICLRARARQRSALAQKALKLLRELEK